MSLEDRINYLTEINIRMGQPGFLWSEAAKIIL